MTAENYEQTHTHIQSRGVGAGGEGGNRPPNAKLGGVAPPKCTRA